MIDDTQFLFGPDPLFLLPEQLLSVLKILSELTQARSKLQVGQGLPLFRLSLVRLQVVEEGALGPPVEIVVEDLAHDLARLAVDPVIAAPVPVSVDDAVRRGERGSGGPRRLHGRRERGPGQVRPGRARRRDLERRVGLRRRGRLGRRGAPKSGQLVGDQPPLHRAARPQVTRIVGGADPRRRVRPHDQGVGLAGGDELLDEPVELFGAEHRVVETRRPGVGDDEAHPPHRVGAVDRPVGDLGELVRRHRLAEELAGDVAGGRQVTAERDMDNKALIVFLVIGVIAGFLASFIVGGGGILRYLISGVLGSFVGGFVLNAAGINLGIKNKLASQIVTSTIGAIIVVLLARLIG